MFEIRLTGVSGATVVPVPDEACGDVSPVLVGTPTYDPVQRLVRMVVAARNGTIVQLHPPVAILGRRGGLIATAGTPAGGSLRFAPSSAGDSVAGDSSSVARGERRWSLDALLTPPGSTPVLASDGEVVLAPTVTSQSRTLTIVVPRGATAFRVALYATGATVFTVSPEAPPSVPLEEIEDSRSPDNLLTGDSRFPGRVVRNKVWLAFRHDATIEQRQAAIDAVQGVVVGGRRIGAVPYYYLRIPANPDSAGTPLEQTIRALAVMPQVQHVMPDNLTH